MADVQLLPCRGLRQSVLFHSDPEMFHLETMLLLLIFAILGTPTFSTDGKSTLEFAPLPGGHLISLNPEDKGTLPCFCHRLNPPWLQGWAAGPSTCLSGFSPSCVFIHTDYHGIKTGTQFCTSIPEGKNLTGVQVYIRRNVIIG